MTTSYNTRLQVSSFSVPGIMGASLSYYSDGRIHTERSTADRRFDRAYNYDHTGRIIDALSGSEAGIGSTLTGPYHQSFQYDAFSNMSGRSGRLWSGLNDSYGTTYVNDRDQNWDYDAAGNPKTQDTLTAKFDTAGQRTQTSAPFRHRGPAEVNMVIDPIGKHHWICQPFATESEHYL